MNLVLYKFNKKNNSTAVPPDTVEHISLTVRMKNRTSHEQPTFLVAGDVDSLRYYTYARWGSHYYFVNDIVLGLNNVIEIVCRQDVLATYRTEIGNYTAFVERSASTFDTNIVDVMTIPKKTIVAHDTSNVVLPFVTEEGCYVFRTVGVNLPESEGGIATYVASKANMHGILETMFSEDNDSFAELFTDAVVKTFFNPFQYMLSLKWFPFSKDVVAVEDAPVHTVTFGWFVARTSEGTRGAETVKNGYHYATDLVLPSSYYSDWRKYDNSYTRYTIFLPMIGDINLNAPDLINGLKLTIDVDFVTGECLYTLLTGHSDLIATYSCNIGIDIQIGQVAQNLSNGLVTAGISAFSGNVLGAVQGVTQAFQPTASINGQQGSIGIFKYNPDIILSAISLGSTDYPTATSGRPLNQFKQINTLSGYIKCINASIPLNAMESDRLEVNAYLNGGFYYE